MRLKTVGPKSAFRFPSKKGTLKQRQPRSGLCGACVHGKAIETNVVGISWTLKGGNREGRPSRKVCGRFSSPALSRIALCCCVCFEGMKRHEELREVPIRKARFYNICVFLAEGLCKGDPKSHTCRAAATFQLSRTNLPAEGHIEMCSQNVPFTRKLRKRLRKVLPLPSSQL